MFARPGSRARHSLSCGPLQSLEIVGEHGRVLVFVVVLHMFAGAVHMTRDRTSPAPEDRAASLPTG